MFDSWPLAAAAYNAGEGKISRAVNRYKSDDFAELIRYGYLKQETKDYVPKMLAALTIAKEPEKYGFSDIEYEEPLNLQTVIVPGGTDLMETARILEIPYEDIRDWNPELRRFCTPPNRDEYELRLSVEAATRAGERIEEIRTQAKVTFLQHNVRKRETLEALAAKYDTSPAILMELNGMKTDSLRRTPRLVIPVTGLSEEETVPGKEVAPDQLLMAHMRAEEGRRKVRGPNGVVREDGSERIGPGPEGRNAVIDREEEWRFRECARPGERAFLERKGQGRDAAGHSGRRIGGVEGPEEGCPAQGPPGRFPQ